jgi:hypothetical protein
MYAQGKPGACSFVFSQSSFEDIHDRAIEECGLDEDHELHFAYSNDSPKFRGRVTDDESLTTALAAFGALGKMLVLYGEKGTHSPTMPPTEPWMKHRYVFTKYGSMADGADTRRPVGTGNMIRKTTFKKTAADTMLRLHWEDNIRAHNNGAACYWELMVDAKRCPGEKWIRGGLHSQGNNNNDHQTSTIVGLCAGIAAGDHTWQVDVYGNGKDCYTGWDPESKGMFVMEVREVKHGMYGYWAKTNRSKNQGEDTKKALLDRSVTFTKRDHESVMRFFYYDNFRVYGHGKQCTWWVEIDGKNCKGGRITQSLHTHSGENDHTPQAMAGICVGGEGGLRGGNHVMTIRLETINSADCYTGWESSYHMEAMEIPSDKPEHTFLNRWGNNIDGRDNGYVNWRTLNFKKAAADSVLRLFWSDNLRVYGHGKWCKWELRIDNNACATTMNISGNRYVVSNQNNHMPGVVMGYCKGVKAGDHNLKVHVRGNGADCYTGWDSRSNNNFVLEVQEIPADGIALTGY